MVGRVPAQLLRPRGLAGEIERLDRYRGRRADPGRRKRFSFTRITEC